MASVSSVSNAQAGESGATRGAQAQAFDRAVILRPSPLWAQLVIWAIVSVTGSNDSLGLSGQD
jgi:hypothetical protein